MKKVVTVGLALLLVIGVSSLVLAHGPGFRGGHGRGPGYGMGSGAMHGGYGYGMGPGAMHGGYGYGMGPGWGARGYDHPCWAWGGQGSGEKLTKDNVKSFLENRLAYGANPNLKVGKITEKDKYFEGEIVTKDNSLVQKLQIDKNTGLIRPVY
ncbi:MAG TPA: hypothetical protein VMW81_05765 [Nitrospinota bacterium]|nr:hypothetical protein [Nitrospinota bacterium]